ncbi:MAG: DUF6000 family protein [Bacteroidetes bacterium]|nr:DUF6000 family protein [Bacteroidota bacterium]
MKKLWKKLFRRNSEEDEIAMHTAGATTRHRNPFEQIEVPRNDEEITQEFADKWVAPFYLEGLGNLSESAIHSFATAAMEIDVEVVRQLLGYFDWRCRITGAYFTAINQYASLEEIIGNHLLKSEVVYAGSGYCLALASMGTEKAADYLYSYLQYYLTRKDLWYDQGDAFCALEYISPARAAGLLDLWEAFVADKENWSLESTRTHFQQCMQMVERIREVKKEMLTQ